MWGGLKIDWDLWGWYFHLHGTWVSKTGLSSCSYYGETNFFREGGQSNTRTDPSRSWFYALEECHSSRLEAWKYSHQRDLRRNWLLHKGCRFRSCSFWTFKPKRENIRKVWHTLLCSTWNSERIWVHSEVRYIQHRVNFLQSCDRQVPLQWCKQAGYSKQEQKMQF